MRLALLAIAACSRSVEHPVAIPEPRATVSSNILREDYAGSRACADCHAELYTGWERSPMHRMTRVARRDAIVAPFDGAVLHVGSDTATMETRGGKRYVTVASARGGEHVYRVTKVIGGRYREDFAGVDVTAASDRGTAWGTERILPVSFVLSTRSWRYKGYSVMVPERDGIRIQVPWSATCLPCHNTMPGIAMIYDELLGPGAPSYQGKLTDGLLPPSRAFRIAPIDTPGLAAAIAAEVTRIGGTPPTDGGFDTLLRGAILETRRHLGGGDLVEVGVGCEACHGGAARHAADPRVLPAFELRSPLVRAIPPGGDASRARWINRTCLRCHTVLFSEYPWTWEGGARGDLIPGGSTTNSGEARDFALGGCASQLACTACHDPHGGGVRDGLDAVCAGCHPMLATAEGLRAHTHHAPGAGSSCISCHMPRKNMGLGYELVPYHRIGSPTDRARILGDRPLECALCHRDKTVRQLVEAMTAWWGVSYDRAALADLYGSFDANPIAATLVRGKPHEQAVAIGVLGVRGTSRDIAAIAPHLAHEYPLVRYYAKHAIERLGGVPLTIDVGQPAEQVRADVERWLGGTP